MFDNYLIRKDSLENVYENKKAVGFRFAVRIADYRGCFLSLHNGYYIECDGVEYPRELQQSILSQYGYMPWDEEWLVNPPVPGHGAGAGKTVNICEFELELQKGA